MKILPILLILMLYTSYAHAEDVTLQFPGEEIEQLKESFAWKFDYDNQKKDEESKGAFAKRILKTIVLEAIKDEYLKYQGIQAGREAAKADNYTE